MLPNNYMTDMFKGLSDNFADTMKAGLKFHEDTARFWFDMNSKNFEQFRNRFEQITDEFVPFSKRNMDRFHTLFDEQAKKSLDLLKQSYEMGQTGNANELCDRLFNLWKSSFETLRESVDNVAKANSDIFRNMTEVVNTNGTGQRPVNPVNATPRKTANV